MSDKTEKTYDEEGRVIRDNKSQLKREREQTKAFAQTLLKLPSQQYPLLPIDAQLQDALILGKRLTGNALKRHLNYLTRLIIEQDETAILKAHQHINHAYLNDPQKNQRIDHELNRLLNNDPNILSELLDRYHTLDLQYIRQLTRQAQKTPPQTTDTPPTINKHQRKLRKYLQTLPLNYTPTDETPNDPT